jgi:hypothetical protein
MLSITYKHSKGFLIDLSLLDKLEVILDLLYERFLNCFSFDSLLTVVLDLSLFMFSFGGVLL